MKKLSLIHDTSTPELVDIGLQLEGLLEADEVDDKTLLALIVQRDELVTKHIATLDEESLNTFANAELKINQKLTLRAKSLLKTSLGEISSYLRGKKAVNKYNSNP